MKAVSEEAFKTSFFALAVYLTMKGFKIIKTERLSRKMVVFYFDKPKECQKIAIDFENGLLTDANLIEFYENTKKKLFQIIDSTEEFMNGGGYYYGKSTQ